MNSKSYAVVFTKETSFCIVRKGMLEVRKITEGDEDEKSLSHTVWEYKYHVVWVAKKQRMIVYGKLRKEIR